MKNIVIAALMLLVIHAQAATNGLPVQQASCVFKKYGEVLTNQPTISELKAQVPKYKSYKAGGIAMMVIGAVAATAGEVMLFTSLGHAASNQTQYYSSQQDPLWRAGLATSLTGLATVGGGIPLYVIGNKKLRKIKRQIRTLEQKPAGT